MARRQFLETLLDMVGARTVLFSTHITSDLERVADRVAVLKDGKIVCSRELDALKDSVKRLHVRAAAPLPNGSFRVPGMLHAKVTGNEAVVSVQDFTADLPERIAQEWSASVAVQHLNLVDSTLHQLLFHCVIARPIEWEEIDEGRDLVVRQEGELAEEYPQHQWSPGLGLTIGSVPMPSLSPNVPKNSGNAGKSGSSG